MQQLNRSGHELEVCRPQHRKDPEQRDTCPMPVGVLLDMTLMIVTEHFDLRWCALQTDFFVVPCSRYDIGDFQVGGQEGRCTCKGWRSIPSHVENNCVRRAVTRNLKFRWAQGTKVISHTIHLCRKENVHGTTEIITLCLFNT